MDEAGWVYGSIGYFLVFGVLLGISGLTSTTVELPTSPSAQNGNANQSFTGAVVECLLTLFGDCSQQTVSRSYAIITDIFGFALSMTFFLFQLLTFQIPEIPAWLNAIIVLPPASVLAFIGINVIRGR